MLELPKREFRAAPAMRLQVPLWIGLYGPSGGGKTKSALRLAEGIKAVQGGPIYGIDTEAKRMLHYADAHKFEHVELAAPFGSLDYLAAIQFALKDNKSGKRPTIILDSMSHEHEGTGGMIDLQDQIARRMATYDGKFDPKKYERVKMLAWAEPKAKRRALINGMLNLEANFILCFRAKESSVPVQKKETGSNGREYTKTEIVHMGFVPIGGDDFIYECTVAALLMPGARGVPTYHSELIGEKKMIKVPEQFLQLEKFESRPLDEEIGGMLAKWADGGSRASPAPSQAATAPPPAEGEPGADGKPKSQAEKWVEWAESEVSNCSTTGEVIALQGEIEENLAKLKGRSPDLHRRVDTAINNKLASIDLAEA